MARKFLKPELRSHFFWAPGKTIWRTTLVALGIVAIVTYWTDWRREGTLLNYPKNASFLSAEGFSNHRYQPCLVQLTGDDHLHNGTSLSAAAARLSVKLAKQYAEQYEMQYHLYNCGGLGACTKAPSVANACFKQSCTHVLYLDTDVFMHETRINVLEQMTKSYPDAVLMSGVDYYNTMKTLSWHDGSGRFYRTDSNTGMVVVRCDHALSYRVLFEWERLCRSYSPHGSDQEAFTLMETLPQYQHLGFFVRDALMLGQYSVVARHFPGDRGKHLEYPLRGTKNYETNKAKFAHSGAFKWLEQYWTTTRRMEIPETERWRLNSANAKWNWDGPPFKQCPLERDDSYVDRLRNQVW